MLRALQILFYLLVTVTLCVMYYYIHFTVKETEMQRS